MVGDDEPEVPGDRQQPGKPAGRPGAGEEHDGSPGSGGENHGVDPVDVESCLLKPSVIRCRGRHAVSLWRAAPEVVHRNGRPAVALRALTRLRRSPRSRHAVKRNIETTKLLPDVVVNNAGGSRDGPRSRGRARSRAFARARSRTFA